MEQRVLFHSERHERIAAVVEAITSLMFPFVWPHVYVPLLPIQVRVCRLCAPLSRWLPPPSPTPCRELMHAARPLYVLLDARSHRARAVDAFSFPRGGSWWSICRRRCRL
jgi:hypothetical protein